MDTSPRLRSSLVSTSILNPIGVEKFIAEEERRRAENENRQLQNRINKLLKEEELIKKRLESSQLQAELNFKQKQLHSFRLQQKSLEKSQKQKDLEDLRRKLNEEKRVRRERIKQAAESIINKKHKVAAEMKKQTEEHDSLFMDYLQLVRTRNTDKARRHKEFKEKSVRERSSSELASKTTLREEYLKIIQDHKAEHLKALTKKNDLSKLEAELLERISHTKSIHLQSVQQFRSFSTNDELHNILP